MLVSLVVYTGGCTKSDDDGGGNTGATDLSVFETNFPVQLAVASPTDTSGPGANNTFSLTATDPANVAYGNALNRINEVLTGEAAILDTYTPNLFYSLSYDADCYGPKMFYENHPEGPDGPVFGSDPYPSLPTGDLGIWSETNDGTEACIAAQLNGRMAAFKDQSYIGLMNVASMIRVYIDDGNTWPDDLSAGTTEDVTSLMNAVGVSDTTFNSATIELSADGSQWTYTAALTYTHMGTDHEIEVSLIHVPGSDANEYEGLLTYMADGTFDPPGNCSTSDVTLNGSLHYVRNSEDDIRSQSRAVTMCDHGESALSEAVQSSVITGNVVSTSANWSDNYQQFTAEFDPATLGGHYSYVWQAGKMDSHSRILNVGLQAVTAGEGYFGFGDQVGTTDGSITGFICNWAGPGNSHMPQQYAQRQNITLNAATSVFEPSNSAASDITYAPTTTCEYDGSGSYLYDRDIDGDLSDEASSTVNVSAGETLELDLMVPSGSATDIWDHITNNRGYNLPSYPN